MSSISSNPCNEKGVPFRSRTFGLFSQIAEHECQKPAGRRPHISSVYKKELHKEEMWPTTRRCGQPPSSSSLLSSPELSDTNVYEPQIRAFPGTASNPHDPTNRLIVNDRHDYPLAQISRIDGHMPIPSVSLRYCLP